MCWAYAKLGWSDPELLDGIALALQKFAPTMHLRDITEVLWAYSAPLRTHDTRRWGRGGFGTGSCAFNGQCPLNSNL